MTKVVINLCGVKSKGGITVVNNYLTQNNTNDLYVIYDNLEFKKYIDKFNSQYITTKRIFHPFLNLFLNKDIKEKIMINEGILKDIEEIPQNIKDIYKTVWEIKQKNIIDMAADRGRFIDQTQSMNLFVSDPNPNILTKMHFYGWKQGLKTGMYYLRTKPKATTQQFTIDPTKSKSNLNKKSTVIPDEPEECLSCGA